MGTAAAQQDVTLTRYLSMTGVVSGLLVMRLHSISATIAAGQRFMLVLQPISLCEEAPDLEFATTTGEVASQTVDSTILTTTPPIVYNTALTTPVPAAFRLVARLTGAAGTSIVVTVSADLVGRAS